MIAALEYNVNEDYYVRIYPYGLFDKIDWKSKQPCDLGEDFLIFDFKKSSRKSYFMDIEVSTDGKMILSLTETKRYVVKLYKKNENVVKLPFLQNEDNKLFKVDRDDGLLTFQYVNYLGRSHIYFFDKNKYRKLSFDVVPNKMDYNDDYIQLTESLAEHCAEILLNYSGSTSNLFSVSGTSAKTVFEQFIFLRHFLFEDRLYGLFAEIKRNPDRILVENEVYKPLGAGVPSKKIYRYPLKYGKNWGRHYSNGKCFFSPDKIASVNKHYILDTPANRFIKYALEQFVDICELLIFVLNKNDIEKNNECKRQAKRLQIVINDILRDPFFDDVGSMGVMPQNNQVLQKREGYSQIFRAFFMTDLALQLDWNGEADVYEGESKNVALLFEYWLFFELTSIVGDIDGCKVIKTIESPFISNKGDKLLISLREGKESCQSYEIKKLNLKVNLYYNRCFSHKDFKYHHFDGSYSRSLRPDYTIAIFPDNYEGEYNGEMNAMKDGKVSYIHFDAKYRNNNLMAATDESTSVENDILRNNDTYKFEDLMKMHTYNDAIRNTIGSYILYPGDKNISNYQKSIFSNYDELLPGVGAFEIKPSKEAHSKNNLKEFIEKALLLKADYRSRLNKITSYSNEILRDRSLVDDEVNEKN